MLLFNKPNPDFSRLEKVLRNAGEPDQVPFIELFADAEIMAALVGEPIVRDDYRVPETGDRSRMNQALDRIIKYWYHMGYDYVTVACPLVFHITWHGAEDTASLPKDQRRWVNEQQGVIGTWEDFDHYPWPKPGDVDHYAMEYVAKHLPDGMKIIFMGPGGQLENMMWLMGMVNLAMNLKDNVDLVAAVAEKVGQMLTGIWNTVAGMDRVGALWLGDDMGFKTGTLISPDCLRRYVFPWQKKLVEITHAHGLPFLLHSCGNLRGIMEDLIEEVGIDAKHSFEDVIMPVTEAKALYGDRIAILGGVDVNMLCQSTEEEVRAYVRNVLNHCMPGGGYALGTGNSVANYIPLKNYVAMLDEGRQHGVYRN
jgi:uroporphyrinogen decarboxylase